MADDQPQTFDLTGNEQPQGATDSSGPQYFDLPNVVQPYSPTSTDTTKHSFVGDIKDQFNSGVGQMKQGWQEFKNDGLSNLAYSPGTRDMVLGAYNSTLGVLPNAAGKYAGDSVRQAEGLNPNNDRVDFQNDSAADIGKHMVAGAADLGTSVLGPSVLGGAVSRGATALGRAVVPEMSDAASRLVDKGMLPTPGEMSEANSQARSAEAGIGKQPLASPFYNQRKQDSLDSVQNYFYNKAWKSLGMEMPQELQASGVNNELKNQALDDTIDKAYDTVKPFIKVDMSNMGDVLDKARGSSRIADDSTRKAFDSIVGNIRNASGATGDVDPLTNIASVKPGQVVDGHQFKAWDSELGKYAYKLKQSNGANSLQDNELARMLNSAQMGMREVAEVQNPVQSQNLSAINSAYQQLMRLNDATEARVKANGNWTPTDMKGVLKKEDSGKLATNQFGDDQQVLRDAQDSGINGPSDNGLAQTLNWKSLIKSSVDSPKSALMNVPLALGYTKRYTNLYRDLASGKDIGSSSLIPDPRKAITRAVGNEDEESRR